MKKYLFRILVSLLFVMFISARVGSIYCDFYDNGWVSSAMPIEGQTWAEFWQAYVDNPYADEASKEYASWIIANGYQNGNSSKEIRDEYKASIGQSSSTSSSASSSSSSSKSSSESSNSSINSSSKKTSVAPTLDETFTGDYVVISKKAVYSSYESSREEIGSLARGTEVQVTGNSSNGFYRFAFEKEDGSTVDGYLLYKGKDNIVTKEEYDAAWEETERVESTCQKAGYIKYTNSLSQLTKKEELEIIEHKAGDEKIAKEPGLFSEGEKTIYCAVGGEVYATEPVAAYFPIWVLYLIIAFCVVAIVSFAIIIVKVKKHSA